jgi:hypothetical protein
MRKPDKRPLSIIIGNLPQPETGALLCIAIVSGYTRLDVGDTSAKRQALELQGPPPKSTPPAKVFGTRATMSHQSYRGSAQRGHICGPLAPCVKRFSTIY